MNHKNLTDEMISLIFYLLMSGNNTGFKDSQIEYHIDGKYAESIKWAIKQASTDHPRVLIY